MPRHPLAGCVLVLETALIAVPACRSAASVDAPGPSDAAGVPTDAAAAFDGAPASEEDAGAGAGPGDAAPAAADPIVSLAGAGPPRQTLRLRWAESWNRHWAGASGADHANHAGEVTLAQWGDGRARVVDDGKRVSSVLDGDTHEETTTTWTTTWTGTWTQTKGKLDLELGRQASACSRTETLRRGLTKLIPTTTACAAPPERLVLRCEDAAVTVAGSGVPAWTCVAAAPDPQVASVPLPWVFGKGRCLETTGGCPSCGPIQHRPCGP